jgi:hypothetical protein
VKFLRSKSRETRLSNIERLALRGWCWRLKAFEFLLSRHIIRQFLNLSSVRNCEDTAFKSSALTYLQVAGTPIISLVTGSSMATSFPNQKHGLFHCNVIILPATEQMWSIWLVEVVTVAVCQMALIGLAASFVNTFS